jgi:hypothetical protein
VETFIIGLEVIESILSGNLFFPITAAVLYFHLSNDNFIKFPLEWRLKESL